MHHCVPWHTILIICNLMSAKLSLISAVKRTQKEVAALQSATERVDFGKIYRKTIKNQQTATKNPKNCDAVDTWAPAARPLPWARLHGSKKVKYDKSPRRGRRGLVFEVRCLFHYRVQVPGRDGRPSLGDGH